MTIDDIVDAELYNRKKDAEGVVAEWMKELINPAPWYKDVVPDVSRLISVFLTSVFTLVSPVPHPPAFRTPTRLRLGHGIHICVHQHCPLSPLARLLLSKLWRHPSPRNPLLPFLRPPLHRQTTSSHCQRHRSGLQNPE
jgi:hypothetical protein